MRILVIGDFHGKLPEKLRKKARTVDLILSTGDFGGSDKLLEIIFKNFAEKLWKKIGKKKSRNLVLEDYNSGKKIINELDSLNKPVYTIFGNWDFISKSNLERTAGLNLLKYPELIKRSKNINYWKRGIKKVKELSVLAFGGSVTAGNYTDKNGFLKNKKRRLMKYVRWNKKETKQIMKHGRKDIDILFAHYPTYGYFDVVKFKGENPMNGKHVGFRGFTEYIRKYQPKIFICGHMHEYQGIKKLGKTKIIATGAAKEGKAVIIDIEKGKVKKIEFLK